VEIELRVAPYVYGT